MRVQTRQLGGTGLKATKHGDETWDEMGKGAKKWVDNSCELCEHNSDGKHHTKRGRRI